MKDASGPLPLSCREREYFRPTGFGDGVRLAGGPIRFARVEVIARGRPRRVVDAADLSVEELTPLTAPRAPLALPTGALAFDRPQVMGILNVTPDSFSDGGRHGDPAAAAAAAHGMAAAGAALIDIGGESTRPGAAAVSEGDELARVGPVLVALAESRLALSIDTRRATVMARALDAGVSVVNDVSALTHDPQALALVAARGCPVVLMHMAGEPATMQAAPAYDDVLLDVYDWLAERIAACVAAGISRANIVIDPGIGFGKTVEHNLALLRGLAVFHGLGCPLLLGASRKALIGRLAGGAPPDMRLPGSLALALHGAALGVQIVRVHDVADTVQALAVWSAARN